MHKASYNLMKELLQKYYNGEKVIDIGGANINGTYADLFDRDKYVSMDVSPSKGVDIIGWENITERYDFVISGQTIEHTTNPFEFVKKIKEICNPGATIIIIGPAQWKIHRYPVDCWRVLPDGYQAIAYATGLTQLESALKSCREGIDCYTVYKA